MLWLNNTTNGKGEEYCLSTTQKVALTWKQMSIGAYHVRWSVNTPPVILIQFATEMIKYGLTKHSKKENLTKDDIPTIFKHTPCKQFFPHQQDFIKEYKVQENSNHCTMGKAKQNKECTGTYDQPVQEPISVASSFTRSKACSRICSRNGINHAVWNCGYHEDITLN